MVKNNEQASKRATLSLTTPSYNLGVGAKNFRAQHRATLAGLLRSLMSQRRWAEASSVLTVYLKATSKEKSIEGNRFKYTALMEVLGHLGLEREARIKSIYDIWIRKNGPMKDQPVERRFSVHVEFIDWCLQTGNLDDAHQTVLWLIQENDFGQDPNSNIFVAKTFYKIWYSTIPKDLLWTETDQVSTPSQSYDILAYSAGCDRSNPTETSKEFQCDSDSVQNYKTLATDFDGDSNRVNPVGLDCIQEAETIVQDVQPLRFYVNSAENTGSENSMSNRADMFPYTSLSALEGLSPSLFPIRLPPSIEHGEDLFDLHMGLLNDQYKDALKYLRVALSTTPEGFLVLRPYIQLLLVGGQVDEALKELEKFCSDSNATVEPLIIRASLLEHFDGHNTVRLYPCFEDILKKDPACCYAMEKLIAMHRNGDYCTESLLEMIGWHLDGTQYRDGTHASLTTWKELASCFIKLLESEEDRMSVCINGNNEEQNCSFSSNKNPKQFSCGKLGENWRLRFKSWLNSHFSRDSLASEITAGDFQVLAYKAACASQIYGPKNSYVMEVYTLLEKENETDLFLFLKRNMKKSAQFCSK